MSALAAELDILAGEELYALVNQLIAAEIRCEQVLCDPATRGPIRQAVEDMEAELMAARVDALMQIARITVPIREAVKIIYRARFARTHPVRVPGT